MNDNELEDMAIRAGFAVNMVGQIVAPAPSDDVRQPLRMFAELVQAAERERWQRIADAAQEVTTGCDDRIGHFRVPSHLMAALALALDEGPNVGVEPTSRPQGESR